MKPIEISTDYITLGQFLKLADCISTGGQAKFFLKETSVLINGEPDNRRGRKLVHLDVVKVEGCGEFQVVRR
ncbi:S4 domain-containing protein YaaA [Paenibacillus ginsengihumi]|uniref:S4 domain-containing protein YaaA n=1 Tax=Paenibacillus ginsengihumi TaxID=431596 RepID=UPI00035D3DDE|nr:S4 domain-containing protein YaaA [Paenibacillus ginsengihumi]